MNDNEADRIAAAVNQLRPDWPVASLRTLIGKSLIDRPRRDVAVALAWVACETNTKTPKRVLEAGPWWKAAGAETAEATNPLAEKGPWCKNCGCGPSHPIHRGGDCIYTIWPAQAIREQRRQERFAELRRELTEVLPPPPQLPDPTAEGERCSVELCIRGAEHTGSHQGPPTAALPRSPGPHEDAAVAATSEEGK